MTKPVTSLYGDKAFYDSYRKRVDEKLGKSLSARLFELAQKDNEELGGKADVSPMLRLQSQLGELTRKRQELRKLIDDKAYKHLERMIMDDYKISFKPPQAAKKAIAAMVKDFKRGKINESSGDFQLFVGYAEVTIDYRAAIDALSALRLQLYADENMQALQDTVKSIAGCLDKLGDEGVALRQKLLDDAKAAPDEDAVAKFLRDNLSSKGLETLKHINLAAKQLLEDTEPKRPKPEAKQEEEQEEEAEEEEDGREADVEKGEAEWEDRTEEEGEDDDCSEFSVIGGLKETTP